MVGNAIKYGGSDASAGSPCGGGPEVHRRKAALPDQCVHFLALSLLLKDLAKKNTSARSMGQLTIIKMCK
jgi:hypothetical protein